MPKILPLPFAIDLGASSLKACAPGVESGAFRQAFQSAIVAPVGADLVAGDDGAGDAEKRPLCIEATDIQAFYVGDDAPRWGKPLDSTDFQRFAGTPETRALFYAALTNWQQAHGAFTVPLHLGVALPNQFIATATTEEKESVKEWLRGRHEWTADGQLFTATVDEVAIVGQANAAISDWSMTDTGRVSSQRAEMLKREVGAVSLGGRTCELAVLDNMKRTPRFTQGRDVGAWHLLRLIDTKRRYALSELEPRLRGGRVDPDALKAALPVWARMLDGFVDEIWEGAWARFGVVVVVGGGAVLFPHWASRFGALGSVAREPVYAVARGVCKMLLAAARR